MFGHSLTNGISKLILWYNSFSECYYFPLSCKCLR